LRCNLAQVCDKVTAVISRESAGSGRADEKRTPPRTKHEIEWIEGNAFDYEETMLSRQAYDRLCSIPRIREVKEALESA